MLPHALKILLGKNPSLYFSYSILMPVRTNAVFLLMKIKRGKKCRNFLMQNEKFSLDTVIFKANI